MNAEERGFMAELRGDVLDAGCGYLFHYAYYERGILNGRVNIFHGFDPNGSLGLIGKRIPPRLKNRFILEVNTSEKIKFTRRYDNIILRYVFSHFSEHEKCIKKLHAHLKNNGAIYFIDGAGKENMTAPSAMNARAKYIAEWNLFHARTTVTRNLKVHLDCYRKFLNQQEFKRFEAETLNFYLNEPETKHYSSREIISLFEKNGFRIIRGLEGRAFGENSLQLIIGKK